jgi:hypothetical protein
LAIALVRLARDPNPLDAKEMLANRIVYIVGAIVTIVALLSFFGLRECASARVCMHRCKRHVPARRVRIAEETAVFRPSPAPYSLIARGLSA